MASWVGKILNSIVVSSRYQRDKFLEVTNKKGVMTRPMWTPMHMLPMFSQCIRGNLSVAENIEERLVNIPSSVVDIG